MAVAAALMERFIRRRSQRLIPRPSDSALVPNT